MSKLNIQKLHSRSIGYISNEDSLTKIKPMEWSDEIVKGNKKIAIDKIRNIKDSNIYMQYDII